MTAYDDEPQSRYDTVQEMLDNKYHDTRICGQCRATMDECTCALSRPITAWEDEQPPS